MGSPYAQVYLVFTHPEHEPRFYELAEKPASEKDQVKDAILRMLESLRTKTLYGDVLAETLHLKNPSTFQYIVQQLAKVSLYDSSLDSKGAAFEYYVRATLTGKKLGQYFTPRPLVEIMSTIVGRQKIAQSLASGTLLKVLDPACGTGGFLVYLMRSGLKQLEDMLRSNLITRSAYDDLCDKLTKKVFFGADANEGVAAAAKMNMVITGDGHSNIEPEDSLKSTAKSWNMKNPNCDLIITNPPFGTSESASLSSDDLSEYPIPTARGQLLFLQKMVMSTKKNGEICTVIDEGVLNTNSAKQFRRWLITNCEIKAVFRLPEETFKPNKINVRSSLLYLRRREIEDIDSEANDAIVFCDLLSLGYVGAGDNIRGFELERLKDEIESLTTGKLQLTTNAFFSGYQWNAFVVGSQEVTNDPAARLDYKYWIPSLRSQIAQLRKSPNSKTIKVVNRIPTNRGQSPPATAYVDEGDGYALVIKAGSNISKFGMLIEGGDYVEKDVYDEKSNVHVQDGDVLLASTGDGTLGKCCVFRGDRPAIADGHVTIIRVDQDEIYPEYLCDYLRVGFGARQIERLYTGSTGLTELTPDQVDSIVVEVPQMELQKRRSAELRMAEAEYQNQLATAQTRLREALTEFSS